LTKKKIKNNLLSKEAKVGEKIRIKDKRKGVFTVDNVVLNHYGKAMGASGIALYVTLCRFANNQTQECYPSISTIQKMTGLDRKTILKYTKILRALGLITYNDNYRSRTYCLLEPVFSPRTKKEIVNIRKKFENSKNKLSELLNCETCNDCKINFNDVMKQRSIQEIGHNFRSVHHITPIEIGGDNNADNLVVLCRYCHAERHRHLDKLLVENATAVDISQKLVENATDVGGKSTYKRTKINELRKRTKNGEKKFSREIYKKILDKFQSLKGITLKGDEHLPHQKYIKQMLSNGRKVDQIIGCMEWLNESDKKIPQYCATGDMTNEQPEYYKQAQAQGLIEEKK
jgi:5-methylcytosine-specific restriction endonuclease McrA